jgi:trk system potassium uptake protein
MRIIIIGAGEVGCHLAKMLSNENHDIVVIDPDDDQLRFLGSHYDLLTFQGSGTSINLLQEAGIKKADLFIAVASIEEVNLTSAIVAKKLGAQKTIARIDNLEYLYPSNQELFKNLGIDYMIYPEMIAAREIVGLMHQTGTTDIVDFSGGKLFMYVIRLEENAPIVGKTVGEVTFEIKNIDFRAVAITRNSETIIPKGKDKFLLNDMVYVITQKSGIETLMKYTGKESYEIRNIMILGGSRIGINSARALGDQHNVKLIEFDRSKSYKISNSLNNTLVIYGDGRDRALLMEEGLEKMDAFIAVTGNSETNILSCLLARSMGVKKTIAEVENMDYIDLAEEMGIHTIINKKLITASRIYRFTMSDEVSSIKCLTGTEAEVMEFIAKDGSKATKDTIEKVKFPDDVIIGGIVRGKTSFIAKGDTKIEPGDKVVLFALPSAISKVNKYFH